MLKFCKLEIGFRSGHVAQGALINININMSEKTEKFDIGKPLVLQSVY